MTRLAAVLLMWGALAPVIVFAADENAVRRHQGDNEAGIGDDTRAIRLDPRNADAFHARCWERALAGYAALGLADCDEALRLRPGDANILNSRGLAQLMTGRYREAIADYSAAIARNARDADSLYGRGNARLKSGDTAGGNADIAAAKTIKPDIEEAGQWRGIWLLGPPLKSPLVAPVAQTPQQWKCTGKPDIPWDQQMIGCSKAMRSGLYINEDLAWTFDNRGTASFALRDKDSFNARSAFADYATAIELDPNYALAYYHRGMARLEIGDVAGGNADIAAAKAIKPDIAKVHGTD